MKIGILTQPLHNNYGGLLQAYALQKVLKDMGHDVLTVDLQLKRSLLGRLKGLLGRMIRQYLLKQQVPNRPNENEKAYISQHTYEFVTEAIQTTKKIQSVRHIHRLKKNGFDAYIVGSDQVWRPCYSPNIPTFFLDFLKGDENIKKIAYAASFGVDHWEFTNGLTKRCKKLAKKFDAISVREDSGISLCEKYLEVNAARLLDPTLLLEKKDYIELIEKVQMQAKPNSLMLYILDQTPEKIKIAEQVKKQLGLEINSVMPNKIFAKDAQNSLDQFVFPPVTHWLRGFMDAEFVITDSFHGTVFSIIFNKPFIVIGNINRGMSRFISLLRIFNLEDRLIQSQNDLTKELVSNSIDWVTLNSILRNEKNIALRFLDMNLIKSNE